MTATDIRTACRTAVAYVVAPVLRLTGFRFSKDYRWGVSRWHRLVYAVCATVKANALAGL